MALPTALMAAGLSLCAPPRGSSIIFSMIPISKRFSAVSLSAPAASSAWPPSRRIPGQLFVFLDRHHHDDRSAMFFHGHGHGLGAGEVNQPFETVFRAQGLHATPSW